MRQTDFARATFNVVTFALTAFILSGCLEQESNEGKGFTGTNEPPPNAAPVISGNPPTAVRIGEMYSFVPSASDADGDRLSFSIQNRPTWADFSTSTGELSGQPTLGDVGTHSNIRISVSDGTANTSLAAFSISVTDDTPNNSPPSISGTPATSVAVGAAYAFVPAASDADGDALTFSITNRPAWASFNAATGELSGTPAAGNAGVYANIRISVSDGQATASLAPFSIEVIEVVTNSPPSISGTPATAVEADSAYSFTPVASDADGDALTFSIVNRPAWASFSTATGALFGTPGNGDAGVYPNVTISVSDGQASASLPPFSVQVIEVVTNTPPTIGGTPVSSVDAGSAYSFMPTADDADGDALTFSITNRPVWASFDPATGLLSGTPGDADVGLYPNITITVSDGEASAALGPFSIEVLEANTNTAPTISGSPATSVDAGSAYSFTPVADDAEGDTLTFSIANRPAWASFDTATGALTGTPGDADVGVYPNIMISVSDGQASDALAPFSIEVVAVNTPPTIAGTPATSVDAGNTYSFTPTASDDDGDTLTFSIVNRPAWASFNTATGTLSGTPANGDAGVYANVTISVSDGEDSASLAPFSIEVIEVPANTAPTISGSPPASIDAGSLYSFAPIADDADGDALTFSITNRPGWASFNASTGELFGTPGDADVGIHGNITITVSDGEASASLGPFDIEVLKVVTNTAPTLAGSPATNVDVGSAYSFTPTANDADGDTLSFSVTNKPAWASFSATTGTLSGTPGDADVGDYANITITVSDGQESATLGPFTVTVNPVTLGSVTLSWTAPTQNEDGTDLVDLAGYKLYWGANPGEYTDSVTIDNPGITTYVVENLVPGTYEFVATSFNEAGVESVYSNPATKVVQ